MTFMMWATFRIAETHEGHSGYNLPAHVSVLLLNVFKLFPPMLKVTTDAAYHDFHHSKNVGNYSSFVIIWDTIFGSNKTFFDQIQ